MAAERHRLELSIKIAEAERLTLEQYLPLAGEWPLLARSGLMKA